MAKLTGRMFVTAAMVVLLQSGLATGNEKLHIPPGKSIRLPWTVTDGAGFRWDISPNGSVNDGTNDAYDGGMRLKVDGNNFSFSDARQNKDGREVELGTWNRGGVNVSRRIYVDKKSGYCRWIDIFENESDSARSLSLQYRTNMGGSIGKTYTSRGGWDVTKRDWALITADSNTSGPRPALVHVFATSGASVKKKPRLRCNRNSDDLYYDMTLKVPAGKAVALCFFEAQRSSFKQAKKFLKDFDTESELQKVPPPLRRIIVNMGGAITTLGGLELPRRRKFDLAVLENGDELLGTIRNTDFVLDMETSYCRERQKITLDATRVMGLIKPVANSFDVQVGLVDGQVLVGRFINAPLIIKLASGNEMSVAVANLKAASFRISTPKPAGVSATRPAIILRDGRQLFFRLGDLDLSFRSQYGVVRLNPADLVALHFATEAGGLHRAEFLNGSILSGLLVADELKLKLDLGPTLTIPRQTAEKIVLPNVPINSAALTTLTLRNDDMLYGRITDETFTVRTPSGAVTIKPDTVASMAFAPGLLGPVRVKLRNGTTVSGSFTGRTIHFQVEPGPLLPVFVGHVAGMTGGGSEGSGASTSAGSGGAAETQTNPMTTTRAMPGGHRVRIIRR